MCVALAENAPLGSASYHKIEIQSGGNSVPSPTHPRRGRETLGLVLCICPH